MPYRHNTDLPDAVREHLPAHAQDIFRETFNSAWDEYADRGDEREKVAFQVAWSAVKRSCRKRRDGRWVAR